MKVLEKGNGQKGWAKELICTATWSGDKNGVTGCNAKLLVESDDVVTVGEKGGDYTESGRKCFGFICPECNQVTEIENLPQSITNKLRKVETNSKVRKIMGW